MGKEKICGIYMIKNIVNNKVYIGQSIDIYRRWNNHKKELIKNIHRNNHLQGSWNKHGEENFIFKIIDECIKTFLDEKEIYWIQYYNSSNQKYGFNLDGGGSNNKETSSETKEKLKLINLGNKNPMSHEVVCLETRRIFSTIAEAEKYYNISKGIVSNCCRNKRKVGQDKHWMYVEDYKKLSETQIKEKLNVKPKKSNKIINIDTNEIFNTMKEASIKYHIQENGISKCCLKTQNTCGGYKWMYYKDYFTINLL